MTDARMDFVRSFEIVLSSLFDVSEISIISNAAVKALSDYEVSRRCTDIAPLDDFNERTIKRYSACLLLDGKSEKTVKQYVRTCRKLSDLLHKRFDEMGTYDIRYYLAKDMERGLSSTSIENQRANISAFFQWLTNEDIIPKNPAAKIPPIKCTKEIRKAFSDVEIDTLRSACKTAKERAIIEVLLATGVRVSELVSMQIDDIDRNSMTVHVKHGKGGKERITYINDVAMRHLLTYINTRKESGSDLLYNKNHERLTSDGVRSILNTIADRAGIDNVHPHRFRRTFATNLAKRGMELQLIQKLMGHSNPNTTMVYIALDDTQIQASYRQHIA